MENKRYFAAANTGAGFYSCFDNINDPAREGFLYILKGGPGTGKSTLMKKVGRHFEEAGEAVEYFHCSSDENSLDGVRLTRINTAVIDGTAPHAIDPVMPGIGDAIINLGEFIGPGVKEHGEKIRKLTLRKKERFGAAYAYMRAAAALGAANQKVLASVTDTEAVKDAVKEVLEALKRAGAAEFGEAEHSGTRGVCRQNGTPPRPAVFARKLFLSAVAGEGRINYRAANKYGKIIGLTGNAYAAREILLELAAEAARGGPGCTSFLDILSPGKTEGLETGGGILVTVNAPEADIVISLEDTLTAGRYVLYRDGLLYGDEAADKILGLAAKALREAKAAHSEIEAYYVPAMDFKGLDRAAKSLIKKLEKAIHQ